MISNSNAVKLAGVHMCVCLSRHALIYRMCPIFQVSNVSGENLDLLKSFLNLLSTRVIYDERQPAEFQIDDTFLVPVSICCSTVSSLMSPSTHTCMWVMRGLV